MEFSGEHFVEDMDEYLVFQHCLKYKNMKKVFLLFFVEGIN